MRAASICVATWLSAVAVLAAGAQSRTGLVRGTVVDVVGVVPGETVTLTAAGAAFTVKTDNLGRFVFGDIAPGPYQLTVRVQGFLIATAQIAVEADRPVACDVRLTAAPLEGPRDGRTLAACFTEFGSIAGAVTDNVGPMPNVGVTIDGAGVPGGRRSLRTDRQGRYAFDVLPLGKYEVSVFDRAFMPMSSELAVEANRTTTWNASLRAGLAKFDPVERYVSEAVGGQAYSCGRVLRAAEPPNAARLQRVIDCAVAMSRQRLPFVSIIERSSIDSNIADGLLGRADGTILLFQFESYPTGPITVPARFLTRPCPRPSVAPDSPDDKSGARFTCD